MSRNARSELNPPTRGGKRGLRPPGRAPISDPASLSDGRWTLDVGRRMLDVGRRMLDVGRRMLDVLPPGRRPALRANRPDHMPRDFTVSTREIFHRRSI